MKFSKLLLAFVSNYLFLAVHSAHIWPNRTEITAKQGEEITLVCSSETEAVGCTFESPKNKGYNMLPGAQ